MLVLDHAGDGAVVGANEEVAMSERTVNLDGGVATPEGAPASGRRGGCRLRRGAGVFVEVDGLGSGWTPWTPRAWRCASPTGR